MNLGARLNSSRPVVTEALANVIWSRLIGMGRTRILFNVFMLISDVGEMSLHILPGESCGHRSEIG